MLRAGPCRTPQIAGDRSPAHFEDTPMQGDPQVIHVLQAQLKNELTAINQYFVHYRMFKHWGFDRMAGKEYDESIGEMKHADALMERLFTLDALPNLQDLGKLLIGETLVEALGCDLASERTAQATVKDAIAQCEAARDYVSRWPPPAVPAMTARRRPSRSTPLRRLGSGPKPT
jgi:bacterioferritin